LIGILILWRKRNYFFVALGILQLPFLASRATMLALALFLLLDLLRLFSKNLSSKLSRTLIVLIITAPFIYGGLSHHLPSTVQRKLKFMSSERTVIYPKYLEVGFEKPLLGHGYFKGYKYFSRHVTEYGWHKKVEQHNLFLQVFTDFGLVGLTVILLGLGWLVINFSAASLTIFTSIVFNVSLINALNELSLYLMIIFLSVESSLRFKKIKRYSLLERLGIKN
jgi:O-antigen ligase